jgi:hypothetical protein
MGARIKSRSERVGERERGVVTRRGIVGPGFGLPGPGSRSQPSAVASDMINSSRPVGESSQGEKRETDTWKQKSSG